MGGAGSGVRVGLRPEGEIGVDVWEILGRRLDYASFVPTPRPDIERADLRRRGGGAYTVLKNPYGDAGAGRYLRLEPPDLSRVELMDAVKPLTMSPRRKARSIVKRPSSFWSVVFRTSATSIASALRVSSARPGSAPVVSGTLSPGGGS